MTYAWGAQLLLGLTPFGSYRVCKFNDTSTKPFQKAMTPSRSLPMPNGKMQGIDSRYCRKRILSLIRDRLRWDPSNELFMATPPFSYCKQPRPKIR